MKNLPPQALELEEAVLGAALIDNTAPRTLLSLIKYPEVFYTKANQAIFKALQTLFNEGQSIDLLTVKNALAQAGDLDRAGGIMGLMELTNRVNSGSHMQKHCSILLETFTRRQLIQTTIEIAQKAYEPTNDVFDLLTETQQHLNRLNDSLSIKEPQTLDKLYYTALEEIGEATKAHGITGVPSGLTSIDRLTGGWQPSDLIILAARPAMGKTSLAIQVARKAAIDFNKPVVIFSLEMAAIQLVKKLIATESNYTTSQLSKGQIPGGFDGVKDIAERSQKLATRNIILDDEAGLSVQLLRAKATKLKSDRNIQLIIVDYLQLMTGEGKGSREQEISSISRGLKMLAKELHVPVIALSQLSRGVESRQDKRPMLSDLRESGAIEQDADMVIFLYRPEYYGVAEDEAGNSTANTAEVIFAKHRNGAVDTIVTGCKIQYGRFYDLGEEQPEYDTKKLPQSTFESEVAPF